MATYKLIVRDADNQPPRVYTAGSTTALGACREGRRLAADGFIGGSVRVREAARPEQDDLACYVRETTDRVRRY